MIQGAGQHRDGRALIITWWCYLLVLLGATLLVRLATDVVLIATVLSFGPRWALLLPGVVGPFVLRCHRRQWPTLLMYVVTGAVLLNPSINVAAYWAPPRADTIRIVTQNIGGGRLDVARFIEWLNDTEPDVVLLQECSERGAAVLEAFHEWQAHRNGGLCLATRFEIREVAAVDRRSLGGWGNIAVRYRTAVAGLSLTLLNVHLETPREGFEAFGHGWSAGVSAVARVDRLRRVESKLARDLLGSSSDEGVAIAGDFNMPVESAIYRESWSDLANAFSDAGLGLGYTKATRWFGSRIDHVLANRYLTPVRSWVGPSVGGDHRPVVADFRLTS